MYRVSSMLTRLLIPLQATQPLPLLLKLLPLLRIRQPRTSQLLLNGMESPDELRLGLTTRRDGRVLLDVNSGGGRGFFSFSFDGGFGGGGLLERGGSGSGSFSLLPASLGFGSGGGGRKSGGRGSFFSSEDAFFR
jgi:hypothetical protein